MRDFLSDSRNEDLLISSRKKRKMPATEEAEAAEAHKKERKGARGKEKARGTNAFQTEMSHGLSSLVCWFSLVCCDHHFSFFL